MDQNGKIIFALVAFFSVSLFGSLNAHGQGFGLSSPQSQILPEGKVLSSGSGRYVFGQISSSSKDQFMLDTLTGRLWRIAESGDVGIFLRIVPYRNEEGKCSPLPEEASQGEPKKVEKR